VYADYKSVLELKGSSASGREVFARACATCHRYQAEGAQVGPDLTGVRNQPGDALLLHILFPDAEIYLGYESYDCETKDGRSLSGILAAETETAVTLRRALGEEDVIPRSQIVSLRATRSSLMPSELEKTMTRQELADLLSFLRGE
jgi:putative heme-binding domain-containing protein